MSRVAVRRTTLGPADAVGEAVTSIVAAPLAATALSLAALLAVGWFVAALGLVSTASGQVASTFAERLPTTILVTASVPRVPYPPFPYPADTERRLDALPGVVDAGVYWPVKLGRPVIVSAAPQPAPSAARIALIAGTPGYLAAAGVRVSRGRLFDAWDQAHAAQVCLVGAAAARSLGIGRLGSQRTVYINDFGCVIAGIVVHVWRQPALLRSVIMPSSTASAVFGPPDQLAGARPEVLIATRPGAAAAVARQAPYVISPSAPRRISVSVRADPALLRRQVTATLSGLFATAGWVGLAIGVLGIAGLTVFWVVQRIPEYALRRAVGARRRHIAAQVLAESLILGLLGGLAGASLGVAVVVLVARAEGWTPVIAPLTLWPGPVVGAAAGMLAGLGPAIHACWIRPSAGLSRFPSL
jgi:putative ABC transport system permease protein